VVLVNKDNKDVWTVFGIIVISIIIFIVAKADACLFLFLVGEY